MYKLLSLSVFLFASLFGWVYSSNFYVWLFLELNVIFFLSYLIYLGDWKFSEPALKYFFVQSFSSIIFLFFSLFLTSFCISLKASGAVSFIFLAMLMKAGLFPLHHWFPYVSFYIPWKGLFFLFTTQKLVPYYMMTHSMSYYWVFFISLAGLIFSVFSQYSAKNLKIFLSFSSISHSGWMLMGLCLNFMVFIYYFLMYTMMIFFLFSVFSYSVREMNFYFIMLYFFSFSGLPPFLGFYLKWGVLLLTFLFFGASMFNLCFIFLTLGFYVYLNFFYYSFVSFNYSKGFYISLYGWGFFFFQFFPIFFFF